MSRGERTHCSAGDRRCCKNCIHYQLDGKRWKCDFGDFEGFEVDAMHFCDDWDDDLEGFRQRLGKAVKDTGLPQKEVAHMVGLAEQVLNNLLLGARIPTVQQIIKISRALDINIDYLVGLDGGWVR